MKLKFGSLEGPPGIQGYPGPRGPVGWTDNSVVDPSCVTEIYTEVSGGGGGASFSGNKTFTLPAQVERCSYCHTIHSGGSHCKSCAAPL